MVDERHDDPARALQAQARADVDRPGARGHEAVDQVLRERRGRPGRACRRAARARRRAGSRRRRRARSGATRGRARRSARRTRRRGGARGRRSRRAARAGGRAGTRASTSSERADEPVGAPAPPAAVGRALEHRVPREPVRALRRAAARRGAACRPTTGRPGTDCAVGDLRHGLRRRRWLRLRARGAAGRERERQRDGEDEADHTVIVPATAAGASPRTRDALVEVLGAEARLAQLDQLALGLRVQRALGGQQLARARACCRAGTAARSAAISAAYSTPRAASSSARHDLVDQPPALGLLRRDVARREEQLARARGADRVDELAQPRVRVDEPEPGGRHPDLRVLGGQPQVAGERELQAAADRVPVERGDGRERERLERLDRVVERVRDERLGLVGELVLGQPADVVAGREHGPGGGDQQAARVQLAAPSRRSRRGSRGRARCAWPGCRSSGVRRAAPARPGAACRRRGRAHSRTTRCRPRRRPGPRRRRSP